MQITDIVSLRPEMELCYLAIVNKCFEILEGTQDDDNTSRVHHSTTTPASPDLDDTNSSDDDSNDDEDDDEDDDDDANDNQTAGESPGDDSDIDSQGGNMDLSEDELAGLDSQTKPPQLKLREILFYDDKVSVFKARHGRL